MYISRRVRIGAQIKINGFRTKDKYQTQRETGNFQSSISTRHAAVYYIGHYSCNEEFIK